MNNIVHVVVLFLNSIDFCYVPTFPVGVWKYDEPRSLCMRQKRNFNYLSIVALETGNTGNVFPRKH